MLLISALALGLVESTNPNAGISLGYSIANTGSNSIGSNGGTSSGSFSNGNTVTNDAVIAAIIPGPSSSSSISASASASTSSSSSMNSISNHGGTSSGGGSSSGGTSIWDNNGTFRSVIGPGEWSLEQCLSWQRPHHLYFQLSNAFFFLAFLAPHAPYGMLWLRSVLIIGCVLMAMWGWLIECTPDALVWSGLFFSVNLIYLIILLCRLRPVRFEKEIEAVYEALFKPLRVSRHQFKKVLNCMKLIRSLKYQEVYAQEKVTKVDSLSLVLSGKLVVSQNQKALHIVFPHQFLDSPEWFGVSTDDYFQVSIMAMEESRVLIWHRDKLKLSIMAEPFLQAVFDHILGRDVVKKLMQVTQVNETMASNGFLPSGGYEDSEDKPMLLKKVTEGHGLTALINRQLQEEHAPLLGRPQPKRVRLVSATTTNFAPAPCTTTTTTIPATNNTTTKTIIIDSFNNTTLHNYQKVLRDLKTSPC